ncbi:MAG: alpha/beta hydrolase [Hydrogenophaga sp.]|uniref:alpha/beta fold hydrolase n=1 Tax=Hydrogenophaga sp. TaxID=1904254 RepID=UPI001D7110FE|nr:alpha/beta hydrolase [Hydrogenophaga sp.]MBX3608944.1 alpha/beta hydrolase [Hydrogenophaga sp.]
MNALPTFTTLGSGPTVLMLHGIGGGHLAFAPQVETLAGAGYRAVAWDMPGYGHSAPIEPYTFKGLAQCCIDLIDALQCDSVTLVGHSMGGMVAQEVIARRPDRVNRLVLAGTSAAFGRTTDGRQADAWAQRFIAERTAPLDAGKTMADVARQVVPRMVGPGALPEGLRLAEHCMGGVPAATYRRALDCLVTFDRQAQLRDIRVPTLLIGGEFDRVAAPSVMKQMTETIPNARYTELKGIGHLMNLEAPELFDGLLLDFLVEPAPGLAVDLH